MTRELTLRDYLRVAWSGRWLILATTVVGLLVGVLLSVARSPVYTATARVYLGQATTISGVPVQTPYTNPTVAPLALDSDVIVKAVAARAGVGTARVRAAVTLTAPRVTGNAGNLPTILTVTSTDRSRKVAVEVANAYADGVLSAAGAQYDRSHAVYQRNAQVTADAVAALEKEAAGYRRRLLADPGNAALLSVALTSVTNELVDARKEATDQAILLNKSEQIEAPQALTRAEGARSSGTTPRRLQAVILAGLIGLAVGILATFVWRGSPAARAADDLAA